MGSILRNRPVKLITSFIFNQQLLLDRAKVILKRHFGPIDFESQVFTFNYTDYYQKEMGGDLKRSIISFKKLILPETLSKIKLLTNKIEAKLSIKGSRCVNIDPGYIDLAKLVLASTKDFSHRIYLGQGIYAEVTLSFKHKSFENNPWTYPDYRTPDYINIFNSIREIYAGAIKK
jgi:hypothetical protein